MVERTFNDAQAEVEVGINERFDLNSSKFSLSRHMGTLSQWITFKNDKNNYQITHPQVWNKLESRDYPGARDLYEAANSTKVILSVTVQKNFVEGNGEEVFNTPEGKYTVFQRNSSALGAFIKKNDLYYIVRLKQDDYFGTEEEFGKTFYTILKLIEFLD